jgi:hypothetical protein
LANEIIDRSVQFFKGKKARKLNLLGKKLERKKERERERER